MVGNGLGVGFEVVRGKHEHASELPHDVLAGEINSLSWRRRRLDGREDALSSADGFSARRSHDGEEVAEPDVVGPEFIGSAGGAHGTLELGGVEADDQVIRAVVYGYTVLIGIGIGSYVIAGFSIVPFLVAPHDINNAIGFMAIGKTSLGVLAISSLRSA